MLHELQQAITAGKHYKRRFVVKAGKKLFHVNREDIAFIYTHQKIIYLTTYKGQKFQLDSNLEQLEGVLPPIEFFRINRQYIVSIKSIRSVENDYGTYFLQLTPENGEPVNVSKYRLEAFKKWLNG